MKNGLLMSMCVLAGCATPLSYVPEHEPPTPLVLDVPRERGGDREGGTPERGDSLEALLDFVTRQHPSLRADHARWRAQVASAKAAGRWADPMVSYMFAPLPIETRLGPNRHTFSASQKIPWFSRTELNQNAEHAGARSLARSFDASYLAIRLEVEQVYWSLWLLDRQEKVLRGELGLLESLEAGLKARVEIGTRPASELSRMGLMRVRLADRITGLESLRQAQEAQLGSALGLSSPHRPVFSPLAPPSQTPPEVDLEPMLQRAEAPPHLRALAEQIARRRAQHEVVGLERMPNFEIGAQWSLIDEGDAMGEDRGRDAVMLRVGLTLPIWSAATTSRLDASQARVVEAQARLDRERQVWLSRLRSAYTQAWDAHRRVRLIETTLLAQARATFDMVRGDYEAERAEFSALLQAIGDIYELELELARARSQRARQISRWNALLGRPLVKPQEIK